MFEQRPTNEIDWRDELRAAQNGNKQRKESFAKDNFGLVYMVIKRFEGRGIEREELFQIGCIGLLKAMEQFDLAQEFAFSTYAVPLIIGELRRFFRDDGMIHVSRKVKEDAGKIAAYCKKMEQNNITYGLEDIQRDTGLKKEEIILALESMRTIESIHKPMKNVNEDGKVITLEDQLEGENKEEERLIDRLTVEQLMEILEEKEKELIWLRYFEDKTQMEIAKIMNVNQVFVSRMEKKALIKMKNKIKII